MSKHLPIMIRLAKSSSFAPVRALSHPRLVNPVFIRSVHLCCNNRSIGRSELRLTSHFRRHFVVTSSTSSQRNSSAMAPFHELKAALPGGKTYDFSELKGKVVLVVNTASACGFTPQYTALQELYKKYKDKDFVILGFPCNQFGGQEPGSDEAVAEFCTVNHGVEFPLMKKSDVNGDSTNEVYKYLKSQKAGLLGLSRIKWNFEKFLIDKDGNVVNRWASTTKPEALDAEIAKLV